MTPGRLALSPLLLLLGLLTAPARAADEVLAPAPGALGISAHGGWVVFSQPTGTEGAWRLMAWHAGAVVPVGVPDRGVPFDADAGSDVSGHPTVVYSRCRREETPSTPPIGCDLFVKRLGTREGERRLAVSTRAHSEFAPSIWRGAVAFGRRSSGQRKADLFLWRGGRPLRRLGAGTLAPCGRSCGDRPSTARPLATDLGRDAVAYLWELNGGRVIGTSYGLELRIARLDGSRARLADSGFFGGACGFMQPGRPSIAGTSVVYGFAQGMECEESVQSVRRFRHGGARRSEAGLPADSSIELARDGAAVYRLEDGALERTTDLAYEAIAGGEARPPVF